MVIDNLLHTMFSYKNICDSVLTNNIAILGVTPIYHHCSQVCAVGGMEFISVNNESISRYEAHVKSPFIFGSIQLSNFLNDKIRDQINITKNYLNERGEIHAIVIDGKWLETDFFTDTKKLPPQVIRDAIHHYFKPNPTIVVTQYGNIMLGFITLLWSENFNKAAIVKCNILESVVKYMTGGNSAPEVELLLNFAAIVNK